MRTRNILLTWFFATFAAISSLEAAELSSRAAIDRADKWLEGKSHRAHRRASGRADTYSLDGTNLFHLVALDSGGFVAVDAKDSKSPVLGFSGSGEIPELDEQSPLWELLAGSTAPSRGIDFKRRSRGKPKRKTSRQKIAASSKSVSPVSKDSSLAEPIESPSLLDSVWVEPLVKSKWGQGGNLYNYCFYPDYWPCGCVATAMAQLIRYHEYPSFVPSQDPFICYVYDEENKRFNPRKFEIISSNYEWEKMPLDPDSSTLEDDNACFEIGKVCYNAAVSMRMQFSPNESDSFNGFAFDPLTNVFRYANARSAIVARDKNIPLETVKQAILPNLDAGFPCMVGIHTANNAGHAVLADGYGFKDDTLYVHLNMGWVGAWDFWYALPSFSVGDGDGKIEFTSIQSIVYNIFPQDKGEIVSGRITDPFGNPVGDAEVHAYADAGAFSTNVTTSANGIYSIIIPENTDITIYADKEEYDWNSTNISARVERSNAPDEISYDKYDAWFDYYDDIYLIGNSWGNDLVLRPSVVEEPVIGAFRTAKESETTGASAGSGSAEEERDGFSLGVQGTGAAEYTIEYCEDLAKGNWNFYTNILVELSGAKEVFIPFEKEKPSCFYRVKKLDAEQ